MTTKKQRIKAHPNAKASILDPKFKYTPSARTNILDSFRAMGWIPPTERKLRAQWAKGA